MVDRIRPSLIESAHGVGSRRSLSRLLVQRRHSWLLCQWRYALTDLEEAWVDEHNAVLCRIIRAGCPPTEVPTPLSLAVPLPVPREELLEDYRVAGRELLKKLSGDDEGDKQPDPEDDIPVDARYALARLQLELARGPVSGGDFGIPKDLILTSINGRLPVDPAKLAGRIIVNKSKAGQDRQRKAVARLEKLTELDPPPPWEVKGAAPFSPAMEKVRTCMLKEIYTELESGAVLISIGTSRISTIAGKDGRARQATTTKSLRAKVVALHKRMELWRGGGFLGLPPISPQDGEDWSEESIVDRQATPWRREIGSSAGTTTPRSESKDELGCVLSVCDKRSLAHMFLSSCSCL